MNLKTPEYNLGSYPEVYDPSEDSFLLLDALEEEIGFIKQLDPLFVTEIGCGSGIIICALADILKSSSVYFATDINNQACEATINTSNLNNTTVQCLNMNLLDCFKDNLFDVIVFNPPYVATDSRELSGKGINRSWAGGESGMEITKEVLGNLNKLLSDKGVCYMVILKENKPYNIIKNMTLSGFDCSVIKERKIRGEHLYILKICKIALAKHN